MVNLSILENRGITPEKLEKKLKLTEKDYGTDELKNFRERLRLRIIRGRDANITNHKVFKALDTAWDTPFRQCTPTLLQTLIDKDASSDEVNNALKAWEIDINSVVQEVVDEKSGKTVKRVNIPAFFSIFVPLVKSYVTIRWAKLMNDRKLVPFLKYEPAISTPEMRTKSEILTSRIEVMTNQFGYFNALKQAVFYMLHYGVCYMFPMEEWYSESQETVENEEGAVKEDGKWTKVEKEGLRYQHPHPSRVGVDPAHKPCSLNTDSGCTYIFYWRVMKFRELKAIPGIYNTEKISFGDLSWWGTSTTFFNSVYNSCVLSVPVPASSKNNDRELKDEYYTQANDDQSVMVTEYFEKLIPSENGLGDYDHPIWFRFLVASDDTILYAAPLPYCPAIYFGYDSDENREHNASLTLEILPFQDHLSNLMTQYLLSVKQNLTNITFVDEDVVDKSWMDKLKNMGEKLMRTINFLPFSSNKLRRSQVDHRQAFYSHRFPPLDTNGLISAMRVILDTLERVLVMSSQEVAQAASHEQTREEVRNINQSTSSRLNFTAIPVDDGMWAMKNQLYLATMAYGQDEFYVQIPYDPAITKETLEKMGFTYNETDLDVDRYGNIRRMGGKAKKTAVALLSFSSNRDVNDRINNMEGAIAMANSFGTWMANPLIAQAIGSEQSVKIINWIARMAGFPREFKLNDVSKGVREAQESEQEQIMKMIEELRTNILKEVQGGLQPILEAHQQLSQKVEALDSAVAQVVETINEPPPQPAGFVPDPSLQASGMALPTGMPPV